MSETKLTAIIVYEKSAACRLLTGRAFGFRPLGHEGDGCVMGGLARDLVFEIVRTVHVLGFLLVDVHAILLVDLGVPLHARGRSREEAVGGTAFHDRDGRGHIFFLAHKLILLLVVWMLDFYFTTIFLPLTI